MRVVNPPPEISPVWSNWFVPVGCCNGVIWQFNYQQQSKQVEFPHIKPDSSPCIRMKRFTRFELCWCRKRRKENIKGASKSFPTNCPHTSFTMAASLWGLNVTKCYHSWQRLTGLFRETEKFLPQTQTEASPAPLFQLFEPRKQNGAFNKNCIVSKIPTVWSSKRRLKLSPFLSEKRGLKLP